MVITRPHNRPIPRNHSNALPRYIIAYDAETLPDRLKSGHEGLSHSFRLGVAIKGRLEGTEITGREVAKFTDTNTFWRWLYAQTASNYTTWLVCHNALFDIVVSGLAEQMEIGQLTVQWPRSKRTKEDNNESNPHASGIVVIESPPTIIALQCSQTRGRLVIVDTMNWFPVSLEKLGDDCGLPKLPMPGFDESDEVWARYCYRDADIVFSSFTKLVKWEREQDFGMFRYTAPSQAMSAFRHRFMRQNIYPHCDESAKVIERQSYFGGRTEVWKSGEIKDTVHQLDINSLFPAVMQSGLFPWTLVRYDKVKRWSDKLPPIDYSKSIAEVLIASDSPVYPKRTARGVVYPVGTFVTTLAGPELSQAIADDCVVAVGSWCEYETANLFSNWVDCLWKMRQDYKAEGNGLYEQFAKRLMNSLYGKFGQRSAKWVNVSGDRSNTPWSCWSVVNAATNERVDRRSFGWQVQERQGEGEIDGSFVAISSYVTSLARIRMNVLRRIAGPRNVLYQGVDGLIVTNQGLDNLSGASEIDATALGKLRLQLSTNHGEIYGTSDYRLADKVVLSGRSSRTIENEIGQTMQRKFTVAANLFNGESTDRVIEESLPWQRTTEYWKGVIQTDGWIEPLVLNEA